MHEALKINHVVIVREKSYDFGTPGRVYVHNKFFCYSFELPWRDNLQNKSCIPLGSYFCSIYKSPKFQKDVYLLDNVKDRNMVEIHSGNLAGNVDKGLISEVDGCILFGTHFGMLRNQKAILGSRLAIDNFHTEMKKQDFILHII